MEEKQRIGAVVVTFNRKELVAECLEALLNQTYPLDCIFLIDNASTDGTKQFLEEKGLLENSVVKYVLLPENVGGAGGFYEGMKTGHEEGFDWLWIMDDDTIPTLTGLEEMVKANEYLKKEQGEPLILASRVNWTDGESHPMNVPNIKLKSMDNVYLGLKRGLLPIRSISFVSVLISKKAIEKFGYPIKKYFIWNDDIEYTGRVLRENEGYLVSNSVVIHKTKLKYTPMESAGDRFFYEVRNKIWMLFRSNAWSTTEKIKTMIVFMRVISKYLKNNRFSFKSFKIVFSGLIQGFFTSPR